VEIDKRALVYNLQQFRNLAGKDRKLLAMVKANAYGHGMLEVSRVALEAGADWLGVHSLEEGISLRDHGFDCPILTVGYLPLSQLEAAVVNELRMTVYNPETVNRLTNVCRKLKKKAYLHVKVETGTHRQGIEFKQVLPFIQSIKKQPHLVLEGMSSHFANIEDTTDHSYAQVQLQNFREVLSQLEQQGIDVPIKHFSCSAAAILFPKTYFDMVRIGISMYGLWPSKETFLSCLLQEREPLELKPVLSWKARIAQIKEVPSGAFIGYGCTYKTTRTTTLAVIPVGYYDGYPRNLSNISYVLIRGKRAPLRGRVAMNFIMLDVTDIPDVELEDEVVIIGQDGEDTLTADTLASWVGTINYEIVARINANVPRVVV
jgi:alanine racemase